MISRLTNIISLDLITHKDEMCSLVTIDEDRKFEDLIRDKTNPGKRSVPQTDPQVQR